MPRVIPRLLAVAAAALWVGPPATAGGILPDRDNRVLIQGQFAEQTPGFLLVFSAKPLRDARGQPLTSTSAAEVRGLKKNSDQLVIEVHGKPASRSKQYEYSFGTGADADQPWNDGRDFHWKNWEKYSPDVWDHVCVLALPHTGGADRKPPAGVIGDVAIYKGGKVLYDSRVKESYPNKKRFDPSIKPFDVSPKQGRYPVQNPSLPARSTEPQETSPDPAPLAPVKTCCR